MQNKQDSKKNLKSTGEETSMTSKLSIDPKENETVDEGYSEYSSKISVHAWEKRATIAEYKVQNWLYWPRMVLGYTLSVFIFLYFISATAYFGTNLYFFWMGDESFNLAKSIGGAAVADFYRYSFLPVIVVTVVIFSSLGNKLLGAAKHIFTNGS